VTKSIRTVGVFLVLAVCLVLYYSVASDYGDSVVAGTYHLARSGEASTLVLNPDHTFQQELSHHGKVEHATGTWRRVGEGGVAFSKEFLITSGQEPGADGTSYGEIHKNWDFWFLFRSVSITCFGMAELIPRQRARPVARTLATNPVCQPGWF
jgi:hypothetical protein